MPNLQYILQRLRTIPQTEKEIKSVANLIEDVVTPRTKGLGTFVPHTSKLSVREQLGLSKGAWNDLNKYQKEALEDYAMYKLSGQFRNKFIWSPKEGKFRYGKTIQRGRGETEGIEKLKSIPSAHTTDYFVKAGPVTYFPQLNQAGISMLPKGQKFGELRYKPVNANLGNIVLTSPKVDARVIDDAQLIESLPNRIDKNSMKIYWDAVNQTARPGTYISGDMPLTAAYDEMIPLGGYMIQAKTPSNAIKVLLQDTADKGGIARTGLSPDSYLAIIKQGLRPEHSLRFGRTGFTKLNSSAVDNAALYNQWEKATTPELKQQFVQDWNQQIYPRTASINENGVVEFLQPYIFMKKKGGKLISKKKYG